MEKIIAQGAEAHILLKENTVIKRRIKKSYRFSILDEKIRISRTRRESKLLEKASRLIPIPSLTNTNEISKEIEMQYIKGKKLSEHFDSLKNRIQIATLIGKQIALLHDSDIIHGDLTTSNMILSNKKLYFIDFGLGFISNKIEDKAVDLHLIKQALEAKHFKHYNSLFSAILKGYNSSPNAKLVLSRLQKVESRGRYKAQY